MNEETFPGYDSSPSFVPGHTPHEKDIQYSIGPYQIIRSVGKGGMGEVLLAYDTKCGRRVALKKIRPDLLEHKTLHERFLKEARITSQLTHPAIMPIYAIEDENNVVYYTMPFVQGETLKQILRKTREQEKLGEKLHHVGGSIPALIRIFISVCQAIAYAHSKGVLHRDLKPENIIIGEYGEILILDWGLAKLITSMEEEDLELPQHPWSELTRPGKVVGTVNFMPPERAIGKPATVQTEIYSLGVILYQILTLRNPFRRATLEEFRKNIDKETLDEPTLVAPYRDVPRLLSRIAMKCLAKDPRDRYASVNQLLRELENYIEGRSEWFQIAELDINRKEDWEFQENVLIAEHMAITRGTEVSHWVSLMISKGSFAENTRIDARVQIGESGYGIGFLMSLPEAAERVHLNDGYCLWLGSDVNKSTKLLRSTVEVIDAPEIYLERGKTYDITLKKIDHNIHFYLNDILQFSYISHLPLVGTHIGILSRDADFRIEKFTISVGSQNITVNCLAVPDAFLAHKDYSAALNEYRRIGYSFPGRAEGREAMFRAGITLLEECKATHDPVQKEKLYDEALLEFEKLHSTPGAPLEYLGKAHVYQAMGDTEEEIKCYELGLRKYPKHPLLPVLHEQLIYRMHETSRFHRKATYLFMLTALNHLPKATESTYTKKLFISLQKHWEPLIFIEKGSEIPYSDELKKQEFRIQLAFWLANPYALAEIFNEVLEKENPHPITLANALYCLIELGSWKLAKEKYEEIPVEIRKIHELDLIRIGIMCDEESPAAAKNAFFSRQLSSLGTGEMRILIHIIEISIKNKRREIASDILDAVQLFNPLKETKQLFDCYRIWIFLLNNQWDAAAEALHHYPLTLLTVESSLLFILYGCWLAATENKEISEVHFSGVLDVAYPRTWNLLSHYINQKISDNTKWGSHAFMWEKRQLYRQLQLYCYCTGDLEKEKHFQELESRQYIDGA